MIVLFQKKRAYRKYDRLFCAMLYVLVLHRGMTIGLTIF